MTLGLNSIAYYLPGTPEFYQRMGVVIVRSDTYNVYRRSRIDYIGKVFTEKIPVDFSVFVVNVTLVADSNIAVRHFLIETRSNA